MLPPEIDCQYMDLKAFYAHWTGEGLLEPDSAVADWDSMRYVILIVLSQEADETDIESDGWIAD